MSNLKSRLPADRQVSKNLTIYCVLYDFTLLFFLSFEKRF
jgi:hypothetical protein